MNSKNNKKTNSIEVLVEKAKLGNKAALEELVQGIQNKIYRLAIRMLWHPADAEDATQEILIQTITHLNDFQYKSQFSTWVYRIATNYLLNMIKKSQREKMTFEQFGKDLDQGLSNENVAVQDNHEHKLLVEEVKIGCSHAMLQCLNQDHRIVYTLGEILEINSKEGGFILNISPTAFRKRLSRARTQIQNFMRRKCGIVNPDNPCRCAKRINYAIHQGRVDPNHLLFAHHPRNPQQQEAINHLEEITELERIVAIYRSHPEFQTSDAFLKSIRELFDSEKFSMLV